MRAYRDRSVVTPIATSSRSSTRGRVIPYDWKTEVPGVFARHADECPVRNGHPCTCGPLGYRASIREWETNRRVLSPNFPAPEEAQAWLRDQRESLQAAGRVALESGDLGAVVEEFLKAAEDGRVADPSGERYSSDTLRELRGALSYVAAELGGMNIEDVDRIRVEHLVDRLQRSGLGATRVDSVVAGLHALFSYAVERDLVPTDPVGDLKFQGTAPTGGGALQAGSDASRAPSANRAGAWPATLASDDLGPPHQSPPPRPAAGNKTRRQRSTGPTLDAVTRQFLRAADEGSVDRRPGEPYTDETLLELRGAMSYVHDRLRAMAIRDIRRRHIQKLVDDLRAVGLPSSVVATVVESLRSLYAFAIQRNLVDFSPVVELTMPQDDYSGDVRATWSQAPRPPWPSSATPPATPPPTAAPTPPYVPPYSPTPGQPSPGPQSTPGQSQAPPYAPNWDYYRSQVRQTLAPTAAMMALGGRVVTWTTRLALIAFVLLVLVLARELGLASLIP